MDLITHFSHRHQLRLGHRKMGFERCKICNEVIKDARGYWDEGYACSQRCVYSIHRVCAEFPEKKRHPFHPHHTLVFRGTEEGDDNRWYKCSLCRKSSQTFGYFCEECNFVLDSGCAALTPIETKVPTIHHQHPVFKCENPNVYFFQYSCQGCGEKLECYDHICVCIECKCLLHEICVSLPDEITHPFHLQHPLTLQLPNGLHGPNICDACCGRVPSYVYGRYEYKVYQCSSCNFTLDVHCASLIPTARNGNLNQKDLTKNISHSHPHPLIQCDSIKNFRRRCFGCNLPFEDFIYVCLDCSILLNKSCVDLPADIAHPFHPQHHLVLGRSGGCRGCHKQTSKFAYSCGECKFVLDLKCATKSFQFVKLELHNHALAYFDFEADGGECHKCPRSCEKYFFRCTECYFSIHDHCCPSLPQTIKHSCHCDPLTFTYSVIKDVPDEKEYGGEFYCHACEEPRELYHPTYYCAECHFIAHVHCVISEIIVYFQREPVASADKVGKKKLENFSRDGSYYHSPTKTSEEVARRSDSSRSAFIQLEDDKHAKKDHVPPEPNEENFSRDGSYFHSPTKTSEEVARRSDSSRSAFMQLEDDKHANKDHVPPEPNEENFSRDGIYFYSPTKTSVEEARRTDSSSSAFIQLNDDKHANKDRVPPEPNEDHVQEQIKEDEDKGSGVGDEAKSSSSHNNEEDQSAKNDHVPREPNEDHVQVLQEIEKEEDDDEATKSGFQSNASIPKEDQDQGTNEDHVLREIDERIKALQKEIDALTAEVLKLKERRAQHAARK